MTKLSRCRPLALLTLALFAGSCVSTQLPPVSAAGGGFEPLADEARLWEQARVEEKKLLDEVPLYDDPLLVAYLQELVAGLNPPSMAANPEVRYRVRVIEDPNLNGFAYPHGSIYLHTGLLARMENEHQLATVLGHEMTHVENRHTIRYRRSVRNKQIGFSVAALAAAILVAEEQGDALGEGDWAKASRIGIFADILVGLGLELAFLASANGYGRRLEVEADQGGFDKMERAGYDQREAPKVYQALLADKGSEPGGAAVFFFGSHPKLRERIASAEARVASLGDLEPAEPEPLTPSERFARRMRPVVRDDAALNIERGRYDLAEAELERVLPEMPEDPRTHYLVARLRLAQAAEAGDPERIESLRGAAREALAESIRLDPGRAEPHRELGLLAYADGEYQVACRELRAYLELTAPGEARQAVRDYVLELERDGFCAE